MIESALTDAGILVVDSDADSARSLAQLLNSTGYGRVQGRADSATLPEDLEAEGVDLIVLSVRPQGDDGIPEVEGVRRQLPCDGFLPVLVVGPTNDRVYRVRAIKAGAKDYLARPLDPEEFLVRVRSLLETRLMSRKLREMQAELEELVRRRTRETQETHMDMLERLGRIAGLRDDPTGGHPARVGRLSGLIAQELMLPAEETRLIMRAAPLHDLGNVAVPDEVLRRDGNFTEEQREQMQEHTSLGAYLLQGGGSEVLRVAEKIALNHHERWDGLGYPQGLSRVEIPVAARIVAVADTFDAMTHPRLYKEPSTIPQALDEIRRESSWQFDPEVVEALVRVYHKQPAMVTAAPQARKRVPA